jgi:methylmalonyl-CoA mutase C-terminal domain/subunit
MDMKLEARTRVVLAKIGLDGHNRGAYVVALGLREAGMEVIYTGIQKTPRGVALTAVQEGADIIGVSSMVGAHLTIVKKLHRELMTAGAVEIPVIIGGIIPEEDYDALYALGVKQIFTPGDTIQNIVRCINALMEGDNVAI